MIILSESLSSIFLQKFNLMSRHPKILFRNLENNETIHNSVLVSLFIRRDSFGG